MTTPKGFNNFEPIRCRRLLALSALTQEHTDGFFRF